MDSACGAKIRRGGRQRSRWVNFVERKAKEKGLLNGRTTATNRKIWMTCYY